MSLKTGSRGSNGAWDKPVKAFIWRSSRICSPIGRLPPWFFEDSLPHLLLRNNSNDERPLFIAQGDDLEEQIGARLVNREVAELVEDEQRGFRVFFEFGFETPSTLCASQ